MSKEFRSAISGVVAQVRANMASPTSGALQAQPPARQVLSLRIDDYGEVLLPRLPALPVAEGDLGRALKIASAAMAEATPDIRDEDGRAVWVAPHPPSLGFAPEVRTAAAGYVRAIGALLDPVAEPDLIRDWLDRWAPHCRRQNGEDYGERSKAILLAVQSLPGGVFSAEAAAACGQRFEWLPTPAAVYEQLKAMCAPYQAALTAARAVAQAGDPEEPAREATGSRELGPEEIAERKASIAGAMQRFHDLMEEAAAKRRRAEGRSPSGAPEAKTLDPYSLAVQLVREIENGALPILREASEMRLRALLQRHPHVAELRSAPPQQAPQHAKARA
jgi:hypothetical protein